MKCNPEIDKKKRDVMLRLKNGYFCILRSINRMNLLDLSFQSEYPLLLWSGIHLMIVRLEMAKKAFLDSNLKLALN